MSFALTEIIELGDLSRLVQNRWTVEALGQHWLDHFSFAQTVLENTSLSPCFSKDNLSPAVSPDQ